ncbi:MAG: TonB-dependent receptor domain-containing protein [Deltaproteobacteria bacterium]
MKVADAGEPAAERQGADAGAPALWSPPRLIHSPPPFYPPEAQAKGVEGDVVLRLTVDSEGTVTEAMLVASPSESLTRAALAAAKGFRFEPARQGALPEASFVKYTFHFRLPGESGLVNPPGVPPPPAASPGPPTFETHVIASPPTSAASAESVYNKDLELRVLRTPADLLHAVPGLFTAQAQGGGKANQYFLRGFDADHGTDVAFSIDGVPLNLPSNAHGQGYTDLHFVLPELIDRLEFSKGPYFADKGDFDTAGAVEFHTRRDFDESELRGEYGQFETYRVFGVGSLGAGPDAAWVSGEAYGTNGPFDSPEGLQIYSLMAKQNLTLSPRVRLVLEAMAFGSQWNASGLIPPRAVADGQIDDFGSIDPNEGGQTQRQMLVARLEATPDRSQDFELTAYLVRFEMRLYNDFTQFLTDPVNGDLVQQSDDRLYTGMTARYRKELDWQGLALTSTLGAGGRYDAMNVSLFHDDHARQPLPTCYGMPNFCDDANIAQSNLFLYGEEDARLARWLRIVAGVRSDMFTWDVTDLRTTPLPGAAPTTGIVGASIANPKLAVVLSPTQSWDVYLDGGGGFHSNDARGIIAAGGAGALPRAWGAEVGSRLLLWNRLDLTSALWFLYLESEETFDPDIDTTVPNPPSRRYGVDFSARWDLWRRYFWADADFMIAHVQYTQEVQGGMYVPLAPTETATLGLAAVLPFGFRARIGMEQMADRAATPDGTQLALGYTIFDLNATYRWRFVEVGVSIQNLLGTPWRDGQFAYVSRLPGEPAAGVSEVDFSPGDPFNVQGTLTFYF